MTEYDKTNIPAGYDRARDHGPEVTNLWMNAIATHLKGHSVAHILDLGCGTGRFTEALADRFNAGVIGIDPSQKMLELARNKQHDARVQYQLGRAEAIPLPSASVDLVFMSMSLHHFNDMSVAARECRRVLRNNGRVVIRTATREQINAYPYVPFIEKSRPILDEVLPSISEIQDVFAVAGFRALASEIITQTIARDWTVYAEKLAAGGDSVLARLNPQDFDDGLAAVRRHAATTAGLRPVVEPIDLFVLANTSMSNVTLTTASLSLVSRTREESLAMVDSLGEAERAMVSLDWLERVRQSEQVDPFLHGFAIVHRGSGETIGTCGFKGPPDSDGVVEIAYAVSTDHQGRGFATEAAAALVTFALGDDRVRVVRAHTLPEENASTHVLLKNGFRKVGEVVDPEDGLVWRWELPPRAFGA